MTRQDELVRSFSENTSMRDAVVAYLTLYLRERVLDLDTSKNNDDLGADFRSLKSAEQIIKDGFHDMAKLSKPNQSKVDQNQAV